MRMVSAQCFEEIARRNAVVYRCLTHEPATALLAGSGAVGCTVHTPDDSLYLHIARGDIWNEAGNMGAIAGLRLRGTPGLFASARAVRQSCDLFEARITVTLKTACGPVTFTVTCPRGKDLVVVDIADERAQPDPFEVIIENWHDGDATRLLSRNILETAHVNRSSCFEARNRRMKMDAASLGLRDPILGRAWGLWVGAVGATATGPAALRLAPARRHRILAATVCQAPEPNMDALEMARAQGVELATAGNPAVEEWLTQHAAWWRAFWERSWLDLESGTGDAEYAERLWYTTMYSIACGCGGPYPIRFNGGPFLLDKDVRAWDGGYWFQNMREIYWSLLSAGHWEFMPDLFNMYLANRDFVRAQTKAQYGIDGVCFKETQTFWGLDVDTDLIENRFATCTRHYFSGNIELCLLMEWYWRASGDDAFLRDRFYPLLKEILEFYMGYAVKGDNGRYHLDPINASETWCEVKDNIVNLCGLRHVLPLAIAWGSQFQEDEALLLRWRDFLDHLAEIPIGRWRLERQYCDGVHATESCVGITLDPDGLYIPAAGSDKLPLPRVNMENPELYIVFPWGQVGMDSSPEERRRVENTWNHRVWRLPNNGWAQDVPQLARMGWADAACAAFLEQASYNQRFPNGGFISPAGPHFHGLLTATMFFDAAGVMATGLNEMLLQSYDGILRVAPAVSAVWSGRFKLHALSGLVVEAEFRHGQPVAAAITATRDAPLRVRNYRRENMRGDGDRTSLGTVASGALLETSMRAGETIHLSWKGVAAGTGEMPLAEEHPEVIWPGFKVRPPHTALRTGHWHDERKGHGQVGLGPDGLYPAVREQP